jgi:alkylation response protein AidB-like acyl-CoA dehydrogenase
MFQLALVKVSKAVETLASRGALTLTAMVTSAVGAEASTNKIFWSELDLQMHETAMRILGPRAELVDDPEVHDWLEGFLFAQAGPIYAGTNEIQRNIIAERVLGLPKS